MDLLFSFTIELHYLPWHFHCSIIYKFSCWNVWEWITYFAVLNMASEWDTLLSQLLCTWRRRSSMLTSRAYSSLWRYMTLPKLSHDLLLTDFARSYVRTSTQIPTLLSYTSIFQHTCAYIKIQEGPSIPTIGDSSRLVIDCIFK